MDNNSILNCFSCEYPKSEEKVEFLKENIVTRKDAEIMEYLLSLEPEEIGGLTAVSGFYYQFLVTIEYFIEMLDGKWDFVAFELHDDIVVGNEKEKLVRFVQVKTSNKNSQTPSKVSDLYQGSKKDVPKDNENENSKNEKQTKKVRVKDSWVDKLISKAQFFRKDEEYKTQFQLYTSYHVVKTDNYNFDAYTGNELYNKKVSVNDSLLRALKGNTHNSDLEEIKYEGLCGESLSNLLSRFYIRTGDYMQDVNKFINNLRIELSKRVFKDFKTENITLGINDIYRLIGMLCSRCNVNGDVRYLKVTKEELDDILYEIREECLRNIEEFSVEHDNRKVLSNVLDAYLDEIKGFNLYKDIEDKVYSYREYMLKWLNEKGNIRELFNRYVDGTIRTQAYFKTSPRTREETLQKLITMIIFLNIVHEETLEFCENAHLITKESNRYKGEKLLSIFNTEKHHNLDQAVQKINLIMENADEREHLYFLDKQLMIILQNYTDRTFKKSVHRELKTGIQIDDIEGLEDNSSDINKVSLPSIIVPGKVIENDWLEYLTAEDFKQCIEELMGFWEELGEV